MKKIFLFSMVIWSCTVFSDEHISRWYKNVDGMYIVEDSINEGYRALLGTTIEGNQNIYIQFLDIADCESFGNNSVSSDPLFINGKLIRFSQNCLDGLRNFFPSTSFGRQYIVNEFKKKNFVEIKTHHYQFKMIFSAKGFSKIYQIKV